MRLKQVKRPYSLEWTASAFISFIFCMVPFCEGERLSDIISNVSLLIGILFFATIFVISVLGLLLGWRKKETVNLDGRRYRLYNKNKKLFLLYTGAVDGLSLVILVLFIQCITGRNGFMNLLGNDYWVMLLLVVIIMVIMSIANYNKYSSIDKNIDK